MPLPESFELQSQSKAPARRQERLPNFSCHYSRKRHSDRHPFRNVMKRYRKDKHRRFFSTETELLPVFSSVKWRCGINVSKTRRKPIPNKKPTAGGIHEIPPACSDMSMAGIRSDQTDAAIITPDANPRSIFCRRTFIPFCIKITIAEPSVVPINGSLFLINITVHLYFLRFFHTAADNLLHHIHRRL